MHKKTITEQPSLPFVFTLSGIQEKYEQGNGILIYLSRYLGAAPIKPEQIKWITPKKEVLFSYWSHREQK